MPEKLETQRVVCLGGLNSNENHLQLSQDLQGSAVRLVNYEVSLYGGYRRIEGYESFDSLAPEVDPLNSEGPVLSLDFVKNDVVFSTDLYATRGVKSFVYTATAGQTTFTGTDNNSRTMDLPFPNDVRVFVNGTRKYLSLDFTSTGTTITFNSGLSVDDEVKIDPAEYNFFKHVYGSWNKVNLPSGVRRKKFTGSLTQRPCKIRSAQNNFGSGNIVIFVDGINEPLIYDNTTWSTITVAGAGTSADPGGPNALAQPAIVDIFENHVFFSGDRQNDSVLAHSAPNDPYDYTATAGGGQLTMGFAVVQFKAFRGDLFVFGESNIKKVTPDLTAGFIQDQVTNNIGCVARDSVFEIGGDLVFMAPDGLRPVAGTSRIGDVELETISKSIQQLLKDLGSVHDLDTLNGVVIRSKSQIRYFVGDDSTSAEESQGIVGGLRSADQRLGWEFGELQGIRASCCTSDYVGGEEYVLHGDYDGRVYRQERGNTFNGANILSVYSTPFFDFGDTGVKKVLKKVNTFIRAEGPLTMNIGVSYDWNDPDTAKPASYSEDVAGAPVVYRGININYGGAGVNYGGSDQPVMRTNVQGSGYSAQINYVSLGAFDPFSIQGLVIEFTTAGRL